MKRVRWGLAAFALSWLLWLPATEGRAARGPDRAQGATVVINEVQYDPPIAGSEAGYEWLELYNTGGQPQDLSGWHVADARSAVPLPDAVIAAGELVVVAAGAGFAELYPGFGGRVLVLGGRIGNGLANTGDQVRLLDQDGIMVDGLSYGDDAGVLDPSIPTVPAGHSLARVPAGADTDTAADWFDQPTPSPGEAAASAPPATPTMAPPPTMPAGVRVVLNEYLPAPKDIDWDGDGQATAEDEWVELHNSADVSTDMRGWQLDDVADGGSSPYVLPEGAVIPPRGYLVVFGKTSKIQLNNGGDSVRLLAPDGRVVDEAVYTKSAPDRSYARLTDGDGPWTDTLPPSPAQPNGGAASTATPPGPGPSITATPPGPGPSPTRTSPGPGPSPTIPVPGLKPAYLPLLLSEVLADPLVAGDDAAWEWVEVYNPSDRPVSLAGWSLGDAVSWDALPAAVVPARGFAVVAGRAVSSTLVAAGAVLLHVADGRIGNGLANRGDLVRLRGPTGELADAMSFGQNLDAFDPAVPMGPPGSSLERIPPDEDTDTAADWWVQPAPSPGWAGVLPSGRPRLALNEVLPAPRAVDWDGDGSAGHLDEWIEIVNLANHPESLADWRLVVGGPEGWWFALPDSARIAAGELLVLHRAVTGLALVNEGDEVRLVRPDGVVADAVVWTASPGYDRSLGRLPDGEGAWVAGLPATPGGPNRAPPAARPAGESRPEPAPVLLAHEAQALPAGARVAVRGRMLVAVGPFGPRTTYLGDERAGLRVYLAGRKVALPELALGTEVLATGRLGSYRGERQLVLDRAEDLWPAAAGAPVAPVQAATGDLGEALEGRLVVLEGRVLAASRSGLTLEDGSGRARVTVLVTTGIPRPAARVGQRLRVVGLASQSAAKAPWLGGYRLLPRSPADIRLSTASAAGTEVTPVPRRGLSPLGAGATQRRLPGHGPAFWRVAFL